MIIRKVTVADIEDAPNIHVLLEQYAHDSAYEGLPEPVAQFPMYHAMEDSGALKIIAAYDQDVLVAFLSFFVVVLPHYGQKLAVTESIFVDREHRNNGLFHQLIVRAEVEAKDNGGLGLIVTLPKDNPACLYMWELGYNETNRSFFKVFSHA